MGKISKNIIWLFFEKAYSKILTFVVGIYVANYLGENLYGTLNYFLAIILLFRPVVNLGLESVVIKKIIATENANQIIETTFSMKLICAIIICTFCLIYSFNFFEHKDLIVFLILLPLLLFQSFNAFDYYFQSIVESKYTVISRSISITLASFLKIYLVLMGKGLQYFALAILLEHVAYSFIELILFTTKKHGFVLRVNFSIVKLLLSESWWLILASISATIYLRIDLVMLGKMSTMEQTGLYSLAVKFSEVFYFAPVIIVSSLQPRLIKYFQISMKSFFSTIEYYIKSVIFLSIVIISLAVILNDFIFSLLFTNKFAGIDKVFIIHLMALPSVFIGYLLSKLLIIEEKSYFNLIISTLIAGINIILNMALIPRYGALGAAAATTISYFFRIIISLFNVLTFKIILSNYKYILMIFIPILLGYFYVLDIYQLLFNIMAVIIAIVSFLFLLNCFFERDKIR